MCTTSNHPSLASQPPSIGATLDASDGRAGPAGNLGLVGLGVLLECKLGNDDVDAPVAVDDLGHLQVGVKKACTCWGR